MPTSTAATTRTLALHPRLFFGPDDVERLRVQARTTHRAIWEPIMQLAERYRDDPPPMAAPATSDINIYRGYGDRLLPLAFACVVSERADLCDAATAHVLTYAAWEQWGEDGWRGLGHAHMLLGTALAYDWLHARLTTAQRTTVQAALATRTQEMYEASSGPRVEGWGNWWMKTYMQNHTWTTHSALGLAALALHGEDERAERWLAQASDRIARVVFLLNGINDGTWHEGISYQGYALTMLLPFLLNLRDLTGRDMLPHGYLQQYALWRTYAHLPDAQERFILPFGDLEWEWMNGARTLNVLRFVAGIYGNGHAAWLAQQIEAAPGRSRQPWYVAEFLYYDPAVRPIPPDSLPGARTFPDLAGVIWRTGWGRDDLVLGFKAGTPGGQFAHTTFLDETYPWEAPCQQTRCALSVGHNHLDTNSLSLARGERWLLGEEVGNAQRDTALHSTLLINGQGQYISANWRDPATFAASAGQLAQVVNTASHDYLRADATRRYRDVGTLERAVRHVLFIRPSLVLVVDDMVASVPHTPTAVFHTATPATTEGRWLRAAAADGNDVLGIAVVAPQEAIFAPQPAMSTALHVQPARPTEAVRLVHLLYPTTSAAWAQRPTVTLLEDTGTALAIEIVQADGQAVVVLLAYQDAANGPLSVAGYRFDGRVAVLHTTAAGQAARLFALGGELLELPNQERNLLAGQRTERGLELSLGDE